MNKYDGWRQYILLFLLENVLFSMCLLKIRTHGKKLFGEYNFKSNSNFFCDGIRATVFFPEIIDRALDKK